MLSFIFKIICCKYGVNFTQLPDDIMMLQVWLWGTLFFDTFRSSDYMIPFNYPFGFYNFVASFQDDVLENNFNILRMFAKVYGPSTAPAMLVSMRPLLERNSIGWKIWLTGEIPAFFTWNILVKCDVKHMDWSENFVFSLFLNTTFYIFWKAFLKATFNLVPH